MIGFDRTITIYNKWDGGPKAQWRKTVVHNASWAGCQKVMTGDGLTSNDGYSVRIPARDMPIGFLEADEYRVLADPAGHWTAQNCDVVMPGEGPDVSAGITEITKQYTDCFIVTAVHTDNMSRLLPHLRIEGK